MEDIVFSLRADLHKTYRLVFQEESEGHDYLFCGITQVYTSIRGMLIQAFPFANVYQLPI